MQTLSCLDPNPVTYDVLISCAGDTFAGFTSSLSKSLEDRGFTAKIVVDHRELKKEEIERFRVIILVLSDHYPTCPHRLDKLAEIVNEFGTREDRRVFPVFFDVRACDVRHQEEGSYAIALAVHKHYVESARLQKWSEALNKVSDFVGWPFNRSGNKFEHQCIEEITQEVSRYVACSVGLHRRVEKVNALLDFGSNNGVQRVVIHGEAGIGKTTVARGVFYSNGRSKFDYHCFLDGVGECLKNHRLVGLIQMLFSKMGENDIKFENVSQGMSILEQKVKVKPKRFFLVLEDILDQEQLQDIVKVTNCFSSNSKVIITVEDKCENNCFLQCPEIKSYKVEKLNEEEVFELLNLKVFNSKNMKSKYVSILIRAKTVTSGVPFIVELIGSHFRGKSAEECNYILKQYENIQNGKKQRIVQMIFDALEEDLKKMLIYIAINLNKQKLAMVEDKLCRLFGVSAKDSIKVLFEKSIIKINEHSLVTMHNLTQNMVKDNARLQYQFLQLSGENMEYDMQEIQPASNDGTMIYNPVEREHQLLYQNCSSSSSQQCQLQLSEENMEYGMQEIQPASNEGTMIDPMEFEHQLLYQNCSSSSSQDPP